MFNNIMMSIIQPFIPSLSLLGVIDRCPFGECGIGIDLSFLWIIGLSVIILAIARALIFGDKKERNGAVQSTIIILKGISFFLGIPFVTFYIFGGTNGGGGPSLIAFFFLIFVFSFFEPVSLWLFGKEDQKDDD